MKRNYKLYLLAILLVVTFSACLQLFVFPRKPILQPSHITQIKLTEINDHNQFFIQIYTTDSMSLRNRRTIESIFYHYPNGTVYIFSNTLKTDKLNKFMELSLKIRIINYSLLQLLADAVDHSLQIPSNIIQTFIDKLPIYSKGKYWYSHETDLIRLLILYIYGGIYFDTDVILMKNMDELQNCVGWEHGLWLNGAIMKFEMNHPYIRLCIYEYLTTYDGAIWGFNGPQLMTRVAQNNVSKDRLCDHKHTDPIHILTRKKQCDVFLVTQVTFHPFYWKEIAEYCFENEVDDSVKKLIYEKTYAIHLNNKVTKQYNKTAPGTLCHDIFNDFCLFCNEIV